MWFPAADWLDRLGCPAGHPGVVMLLVCRPCCAIHPPPHADLPAGANSTCETVLRASRTPGRFLARWITEDQMRLYITRDVKEGHP
ncbi:MAG: hypothetical protein JO034_20475, partial [Singulisphaera sp.]|nr:hypothetical protein [Singulisphaera sp.]